MNVVTIEGKIRVRQVKKGRQDKGMERGAINMQTLHVVQEAWNADDTGHGGHFMP